MSSLAISWGSTAEERTLAFGCDGILDDANGEYWRAVTIDAPPEIIFRWLCQMRRAPYSYDWIDNLGRTSPQQLQPELAENLAIGQTMMFIFKVISFEQGRELTLATGQDGIFQYITGAGVISYRIIPVPNAQNSQCRLVGKLVMAYPRNPIGWLVKLLLPWGDLLMMRRQLLNFKQLAERDALQVQIS